MRRSARLRSVTSRSTKMLPWKPGSSLEITEALTETGIVWPRTVRTTVSPGSASNFSIVKASRCGSATSDSNSSPTSSPVSKPSSSQAASVDRSDPPVRRGDQHGVAHAVQQRVEVIARDRRARERLPHLLERRRQRCDLRHVARRDRVRVHAATDALGAGHQRRHGPVDPRNHPGRDPGGQQREHEAGTDQPGHLRDEGMRQQFAGLSAGQMQRLEVSPLDGRDDQRHRRRQHEADRQHDEHVSSLQPWIAHSPAARP